MTPGPAVSARPAKRSAGWIAALALVLPVTGCERSPVPGQEALPEAADAAKSRVIVFVGAGQGNPLWPLLRTSAQLRADALARCRLKFVNPEGRSPQDQIECLRSLQEPDMRGLCIQITDTEAVRPILELMHNRGIRIVSMIRAAPRELRVGHVGFDDRAIGQALGEATAQALGGSGSMAVLLGGPGDATSEARRLAFEETIRQYPDLVVFTRQECGGDPRRAREMIRSYLQRFPRLSAWVAMDDWPLRDRGLDQLPFSPPCKFITFGGTPEQWPLIEDGTGAALVAADYGELGAKAVQFCETAIREPPRFQQQYTAPVRIVWPTSLEAYKRDWAYWSTGRYPEREAGM